MYASSPEKDWRLQRDVGAALRNRLGIALFGLFCWQKRGGSFGYAAMVALQGNGSGLLLVEAPDRRSLVEQVVAHVALHCLGSSL